MKKIWRWLTSSRWRLIYRWLAHLRSDAYKQGHNTLCCSFERYCVLGVLCKLYDSNGFEWDEDTAQYVYQGYRTQFPTLRVLEAAGITREQCERWALLNDHERYTFGELARVIELELA